MRNDPYQNAHLLANAGSRDALHRIVALCQGFAARLPADEPAQAEALEKIIASAGEEIRRGRLALVPDFAGQDSVIRLFKAPAGDGRLKLQLFPLCKGEAHPPHAHYNLMSLQIVLRGRARVREYSLLQRLEGDLLEIREEPEKRLEPGDGVFTLQKRNNIHWQEGLEDGTVLLNVNWQGYFSDTPMSGARSQHGRCYIDWERARPGDGPGTIIVPEVLETAAV